MITKYCSIFAPRSDRDHKQKQQQTNDSADVVGIRSGFGLDSVHEVTGSRDNGKLKVLRKKEIKFISHFA